MIVSPIGRLATVREVMTWKRTTIGAAQRAVRACYEDFHLLADKVMEKLDQENRAPSPPAAIHRP